MKLRFIAVAPALRGVSIDSETGQQAGRYAHRYRKAHQGTHQGISLEDFLLAASARQNRCPLWTGNRKHYPMDDIVLFVPT